ncbi:MAG TPA: serine/threonine-protein kinase [Kofleriaceae bacterium]
MKVGGAKDLPETHSVAPTSALTRNSDRTIESDLSESDPAHPGIGPQLRDPQRYHIMGEHGRGGLGRVSRAHDRELGRDVAIKELISRGKVDEVRFLREALITARLEHPGIVPVHEAGRWPDGTPFYAMKLVSGRSLRDLIAERTTIDERIDLLHHVIAVADAIAYAHGRNIIHRDLKPGNVIVGDFGETIVIDWGLAKDITSSDESVTGGDSGPSSGDDELTAAGSVLGTPAYMAPEQKRGEHVDQRADVFAIGAMLWELCSLRKTLPAQPGPRHRMLRSAGIDRDLITIINKALDQDPGRRYPDAAALAADLKAFKSGARIAARSYSLFAMLAHWTRRHRTLAISVLAALALAAAGIVVYVRNVATERDRADAALATAERERDRAKLSEASLLLEKDPTRAKERLDDLALRSPEYALLISRARQLAATRVVTISADVDGLFRAPDATTVELVTRDGNFHRLDPVNGVVQAVDHDLTGGVVTLRRGQWLYARKPSGASSVHIASPSNADLFDAELTSVSHIIALADAVYVLDAAGDLHRLDGKSHAIVERGVHNIAGAGDVRMVCKTSGELDVYRHDAVVLHSRCPASKSPATMAVVHGDYVALTADGTLVTSRNGRQLDIPTPIRGEYELALSGQGVIALADYGTSGTSWFVRPDGDSLEAGPTHASQLYSVAADGNLVAWGYKDGTVIALDTTTGVQWKLRGHSAQVTYVVIDAAHDRVVSGGNRELRVWDLKKPPSTLIKAMPCAIIHVELSPDGRQAATDCQDGSVWTWSRDSNVVVPIQRHVGLSFGVQWVKGMVCSGGWVDGRVLCSAPDGSNLQTIDSGESRIMAVIASLDHDYLMFASGDGKIWRYDGKLSELYAHTAVPNRLAISPDGRALASCAFDGSFAVYDLVNHRLVTHLAGHVGAATAVAWTGDELWTAGDDGALKRWGFHNGAVTLRQRLQVKKGAVSAMRVVHGSWAATYGEGVLLISRDGDSVALRLDLGRKIETLDISPDRRYVAAGTNTELAVIDLQRNAIAALSVGFPAPMQLGFLDATTLEVSEAAALRTLRVDQLDYVPYEPIPLDDPAAL